MSIQAILNMDFFQISYSTIMLLAQYGKYWKKHFRKEDYFKMTGRTIFFIHVKSLNV